MSNQFAYSSSHRAASFSAVADGAPFNHAFNRIFIIGAADFVYLARRAMQSRDR